MTIRKIDDDSGNQVNPSKDLPNVSIDKLGSGFGKSEAPQEMIENSISSVQAIRNQIDLDAEKLNLSASEYLVMLALEHERNQESPSVDINIVIVRFIVHLAKVGKSHVDLIHDLQEIRENLNRFEKPEMRFSQNDQERLIIQTRLKSLFN